MPRASRPWFRFYVEAVSDQKLRRLTPAQRWLWVGVLAAARQSPISGFLMISEREALSTADLADLAAVPCKEVARTLHLFEKAGMLEWDSSLDTWKVKNWNVRQFESDNVTERTRKFRSNEPRNPVPGNDRRNVSTSFVGTRSETETETETESSSRAAPPRPPPDDPADDDDDENWKPGTADIDRALDLLVARRFAASRTRIANIGGWRAVTKKAMWTELSDLIETAGTLEFHDDEDLANYLEPHHNPVPRTEDSAQRAAQRNAAKADLAPCPKCNTRGGGGWVPAPEGNGVIRCPECAPQHAQAAS